MQEQLTVGYGLCECGCGERTRIAERTHRPSGQTKGEPMRFVNGHNRRLSPLEYIIRDCGYETPCWVWQRAINVGGYGVDHSTGPGLLAHVRKWEQVNGRVPLGLVLDHLCSNPPCVNPAHLEAVTQAENVRRSNAAKLSADDVRAIRESTETERALGARYGVSHSAIGSIRRGKSWRGV